MERPLVIGKGQKEEVRPGVWQIRHSLGKDPETGKYRYSPKRTVYTKKKREVDAALEEYKQELNSGIFTKPTSDTIGDFSQRFHENRAGTMSPLSYDREELDIKHINEIFGTVKLQNLRASMIEDAYAKIRKEGRYSESELHKIHAKLRQILDIAVRDELIAKNPCAFIKVPRPKPKERKYLSAEEAGRLRKCLLAEEPEARIIVVFLMLETGMRRGEALGFTWEHVDLENNVIHVEQQYAKDKQPRRPKSPKSRRVVAISAVFADYLKRWKDKQAEELATVNLKPVDGTPLAHSLSGRSRKQARTDEPVTIKFMDPDVFSRWFREWCAKNGFGKFEKIEEYYDAAGVKRYKKTGYHGLTSHMLRHTQATLLISEGVDIKSVQNRLGHSSVNLTLDVYSHAVAERDRDAADAFDKLLSGNE